MMLQKNDSAIYDLIEKERQRQREGLEMIPSENYVSSAVREAVGSIFENKYAEGYPKARYYTGNEYVDQLETLAQDRAKELFGVPFVNVQPHSGCPANLEILGAVCEPGVDLMLSQELSHGGHLSMGQTASFSSKYYKSAFYHLTKDGEVDFDELEKLAKELKPKVIWSGGTGYTKIFKWEKYAQIADSVGAYFIADISHIAGLVAAGAHPSPVPYAHIIMTTTHKTLRGPRGAMIMVTQKGIDKSPDLPKKIDFSVFPGHQGGPHMNKIAGIAVALKEAQTDTFKAYASQIVKNAQALSESLKKFGFTLVGNGSENHMVWIDLTGKGIEGWHAHVGLEQVYIFGNKQTIPSDPRSPFYPSGYRLGTPALTSRGMKEKEMERIAGFINEGVEILRELHTGDIATKDEAAKTARAQFKKNIASDPRMQVLREKVQAFAREFPVEPEV